MIDSVDAIKVALYQLPLDEPLHDAMHGVHTHFELVIVKINLSGGGVGTGYTYTGGKGGHAIKSMIEHDLSSLIIGQNASTLQAIDKLNQKMHWWIHYVGRGGIASFTISAIDIALWDAYCKGNKQPLWKVAGGASNTCRAYRGGIDLDYSLPKLLDSVQGYLEEGFNAVKIKVGKPNLSKDIERVQAVRTLIGSKIKLMVDANYSFQVDTAIKAAQAFSNYDVLWFEEPIIPDHFKKYGRIAKETGVPLAMGENLHTLEEFQHAFSEASLSYIQPDASNCGGITNWLKVARWADEYNLLICSHGIHELHVSLVASQLHAGWLEVHSFPIDRYTQHPLKIKDHQAVVPLTSGTGVEFNFEKIKAFDQLKNY